MRIYLAIALGALSLLALMGLTAPYWVDDYLATPEFRQAVFTEIGSFILTSAVVGGLSAAVADYLRRRELRPLRRRALLQIDNAVLAVLDHVHKIAREGPDASHLAFFADPACPMGVVVTEGYRLEPPRRAHGGVIRNSWHRITATINRLQRHLDRFAVCFDVGSQDDLAVIEQFFDDFRERMNFIDYALGAQPGGYRAPGGAAAARLEDYRALQQALLRLAAQTGLVSRAAGAIGESELFFADDARHLMGAIAAMNPENAALAGAARMCRAWWDYGWSAEDMAAQVQARVPRQVLGVSHEMALSVAQVRERFGSQVLAQWQELYPPRREPDPGGVK